MVRYPLLPQPQARRRIPRQFSISSILVLTTIVAVAIALFKEDGFGVVMLRDGGLFVIAGMVASMIMLVAIAMVLSKLPSPAAGAICVAMLIGVAIATVAVSNGWYDAREYIHRLLGPSRDAKKYVELVIFWAGFLAISCVSGTILGYGIALSRERH